MLPLGQHYFGLTCSFRHLNLSIPILSIFYSDVTPVHYLEIHSHHFQFNVEISVIYFYYISLFPILYKLHAK